MSPLRTYNLNFEDNEISNHSANKNYRRNRRRNTEAFERNRMPDSAASINSVCPVFHRLDNNIESSEAFEISKNYWKQCQERAKAFHFSSENNGRQNSQSYPSFEGDHSKMWHRNVPECKMSLILDEGRNGKASRIYEVGSEEWKSVCKDIYERAHQLELSNNAKNASNKEASQKSNVEEDVEVESYSSKCRIPTLNDDTDTSSGDDSECQSSSTDDEDLKKLKEKTKISFRSDAESSLSFENDNPLKELPRRDGGKSKVLSTPCCKFEDELNESADMRTKRQQSSSAEKQTNSKRTSSVYCERSNVDNTVPYSILKSKKKRKTPNLYKDDSELSLKRPSCAEFISKKTDSNSSTNVSSSLGTNPSEFELICNPSNKSVIKNKSNENCLKLKQINKNSNSMLKAGKSKENRSKRIEETNGSRYENKGQRGIFRNMFKTSSNEIQPDESTKKMTTKNNSKNNRVQSIGVEYFSSTKRSISPREKTGERDVRTVDKGTLTTPDLDESSSKSQDSSSISSYSDQSLQDNAIETNYTPSQSSLNSCDNSDLSPSTSTETLVQQSSNCNLSTRQSRTQPFKSKPNNQTKLTWEQVLKCIRKEEKIKSKSHRKKLKNLNKITKKMERDCQNVKPAHSSIDVNGSEASVVSSTSTDIDISSKKLRTVPAYCCIQDLINCKQYPTFECNTKQQPNLFNQSISASDFQAPMSNSIMSNPYTNNGEYQMPNEVWNQFSMNAPAPGINSTLPPIKSCPQFMYNAMPYNYSCESALSTIGPYPNGCDVPPNCYSFNQFQR